MAVRTLVTLALLLGSTVPLRSQPAAAPGNIFDVRRFGATGKKADNATKAIRDAVEACFAAGGGVVYVPPGQYTTGAIELKNNVNLHLEAGATLFLSQDRADFGDRRAMIYAERAKNIAVTGRGTLDGLAQYELAEARGPDPQIAREIEIARQAGVDMRRYYRTGMQTYMFILNDSTDVRLEGITVINSPLWNVRLNDCDRVFIRGVHIYSDLEKGVNSDGIDVVSSSNVVISDSIVVTGDDAIVIKTSGRDGAPAKPSRNITVTNCIVSSSSAALKIGTETEADIQPRDLQQHGGAEREQGSRHRRAGRRPHQRHRLLEHHHRDEPPPLELVGQRGDLQVRSEQEEARFEAGVHSERRG